MNRLCSLVAETLGIEASAVGPKTGPGNPPKWDSFAHIQLVAVVEETYGVQMSTDEIVNLLSISDIAKLLQEKGVKID